MGVLLLVSLVWIGRMLAECVQYARLGDYGIVLREVAADCSFSSRAFLCDSLPLVNVASITQTLYYADARQRRDHQSES